MNDLLAQLKELSISPGLPGNEGSVREQIKKHWQPFTDEFRISKLGSGPGILLKSGRYFPHPCVKNALETAADHAKITYQYVIREKEESEAAVIQTAYTGIHAGGLYVPYRYYPTAAEMVIKDDITNTVELLYTVLMEPDLLDES